MIAIAKRWYQLIFHVDCEESPTSCLVDSVQVIPMAINPSGNAFLVLLLGRSGLVFFISGNCRWALDRRGSFGERQPTNKASTLN